MQPWSKSCTNEFNFVAIYLQSLCAYMTPIYLNHRLSSSSCPQDSLIVYLGKLNQGLKLKKSPFLLENTGNNQVQWLLKLIIYEEFYFRMAFSFNRDALYTEGTLSHFVTH